MIKVGAILKIVDDKGGCYLLKIAKTLDGKDVRCYLLKIT